MTKTHPTLASVPSRKGEAIVRTVRGSLFDVTSYSSNSHSFRVYGGGAGGGGVELVSKSNGTDSVVRHGPIDRLGWRRPRWRNRPKHFLLVPAPSHCTNTLSSIKSVRALKSKCRHYVQHFYLAIYFKLSCR